MADERRMSESISGYPHWKPEMGISATPALPAILASGWEEHHKSQSALISTQVLAQPVQGGIIGILPSLTAGSQRLSHLPLASTMAHTDILQRLGKLKARDHLALVKLNEQADVKPAIFCCLDLCVNHKPTTLTA